MTTFESIRGIVIALIISGLITFAASQGGGVYLGIPLFAICTLFAFAMQWLVFIPSYIYRAETYYDFTGSITYLGVVVIALWLTEQIDFRGILIALLVSVWAVRLGTFLFARIKSAGSDRRFDEMKTVPVWFLMTWTLQGLWVVVTLSAGLAAMTSNHKVEFGLVGAIGLSVWLLGFFVEVLADYQKSQFRKANQGGFITTGIWSWSRHPNYFGEMTLWLGMAIIAIPALVGWQWVTMISPLFVFVLLTRVSGVSMLEKSANERWGDDEQYQAYVAKTSVLVPMPPSAQAKP